MNTHVSSLQFMCLSKTIERLFNIADIKKRLHEIGHKCLHPHRHLAWLEMRGKELASSLPLPASVKNELMDVLLFMALEVCDWYEKHKYLISYDFEVLSSFHWRSDGTIDELKTAKALARRRDANIASRFRIASFYRLTPD
ncbi:hypothetical protein CDAR_235671 [Caerostris darwini]|uniref:Uncharacterized protein n=1 Tax=Caerostris darwini TaxID=1538125 RepID=A0AAV4UE56_9ARAC|nr:hypothetical protein CDAR_412261 [Caerostris darwini]GIY55815.1 hypothetical protein CDAR_235671 [Caerostris darwini]